MTVAPPFGLIALISIGFLFIYILYLVCICRVIKSLINKYLNVEINISNKNIIFSIVGGFGFYVIFSLFLGYFEKHSVKLYFIFLFISINIIIFRHIQSSISIKSKLSISFLFALIVTLIHLITVNLIFMM